MEKTQIQDIKDQLSNVDFPSGDTIKVDEQVTKVFDELDKLEEMIV